MSRSDPVREALLAFLRERGAGEARHGRGRPLLEHLSETAAVLARWHQPETLQHAALLHSVYGTDAYRHELLGAGDRGELAAIAGDQAERLAYLFSITPRGPLLAGTYRWAPQALGRQAEAEAPPSRDELDALVMLHMANLAEQAATSAGAPGRWLVKLHDYAELVMDSETITLPGFLAGLAGLSSEDEAELRRAYRAALLLTDDLEARATRLAASASLCAVVPEPCVWLAHLAAQRGDEGAARTWVRLAGRRLDELGTVWDKRLSFEEWAKLIRALGDRPRAERANAAEAARAHADPRTLYEAIVERDAPERRPRVRAVGGGARFQRYLDSLAQADPDGPPPGRMYPDLESAPWHDPADFPLAGYLESHYDVIREEILALDPHTFHRESESIARSGDWDVAFFYERGHRHDETCARCPVSTRAIETYGAMRTMAGLSYASRMRPGTHIAAHRGPTNLRLRCHLGIQVPDGDCALRVGDETRRWQNGRCLVFDDHFEHEAWNHTGDERVVLIVDLWHPGLSAEEVRLLEGLHRYTDAHARRLHRYWAANAAAATLTPARSAARTV